MKKKILNPNFVSCEVQFFCFHVFFILVVLYKTIYNRSNIQLRY